LRQRVSLRCNPKNRCLQTKSKQEGDDPLIRYEISLAVLKGGVVGGNYEPGVTTGKLVTVI